jgi:hypothetical protein
LAPVQRRGQHLDFDRVRHGGVDSRHAIGLRGVARQKPVADFDGEFLRYLGQFLKVKLANPAFRGNARLIIGCSMAAIACLTGSRVEYGG